MVCNSVRHIPVHSEATRLLTFISGSFTEKALLSYVTVTSRRAITCDLRKDNDTKRLSSILEPLGRVIDGSRSRRNKGKMIKLVGSDTMKGGWRTVLLGHSPPITFISGAYYGVFAWMLVSSRREDMYTRVLLEPRTIQPFSSSDSLVLLRCPRHHCMCLWLLVSFALSHSHCLVRKERPTHARASYTMLFFSPFGPLDAAQPSLAASPFQSTPHAKA